MICSKYYMCMHTYGVYLRLTYRITYVYVPSKYFFIIIQVRKITFVCLQYSEPFGKIISMRSDESQNIFIVFFLSFEIVWWSFWILPHYLAIISHSYLSTIIARTAWAEASNFMVRQFFDFCLSKRENWSQNMPENWGKRKKLDSGQSPVLVDDFHEK